MSDATTTELTKNSLRCSNVHCHCSTPTDDVTLEADPYAEKIDGDSTPVLQCARCRYESCQGI